MITHDKAPSITISWADGVFAFAENFPGSVGEAQRLVERHASAQLAWFEERITNPHTRTNYLLRIATDGHRKVATVTLKGCTP